MEIAFLVNINEAIKHNAINVLRKVIVKDFIIKLTIINIGKIKTFSDMKEFSNFTT